MQATNASGWWNSSTTAVAAAVKQASDSSTDLVRPSQLSSVSAMALAMMLELEGHATCIAFSAHDGLRLAANFGPDIAFLDIGMPGMNGYELAVALRRLPGLAHMRLVAVSGWGGDEDKRRSAEAGFDQMGQSIENGADATGRAVGNTTAAAGRELEEAGNDIAR